MKYVYLVSMAIGTMCAAQQEKFSYPEQIAQRINFEIINKTPHFEKLGKSFTAAYVNSKDGSILLDINRLGRIGDYYLIQNGKLITNPQEMASVNGKDNGLVRIGSGDTFAAHVKVDKPTIIRLVHEWPRTDAAGEWIIDAKGKTRFLTFEVNKKDSIGGFYPQTGPLQGIGKFTPNFLMEDRTNSGLLKRNNVTLKEIQFMGAIKNWDNLKFWKGLSPLVAG